MSAGLAIAAIERGKRQSVVRDAAPELNPSRKATKWHLAVGTNRLDVTECAHDDRIAVLCAGAEGISEDSFALEPGALVGNQRVNVVGGHNGLHANKRHRLEGSKTQQAQSFGTQYYFAAPRKRPSDVCAPTHRVKANDSDLAPIARLDDENRSLWVNREMAAFQQWHVFGFKSAQTYVLADEPG
jgi:hypothetical protein